MAAAAAAADYLRDLNFGATAPEFSTATNVRVTQRATRVPEIPMYYIGRDSFRADKCYAVVGPLGGRDAKDGGVVDATTGDPAAPTTKVKLYEYTGPDRTTLRINVWAQGQGMGMPTQFVMYKSPFIMREGDFFTGSCDMKKHFELPPRACLPCKQTNLGTTFWMKAGDRAATVVAPKEGGGDEGGLDTGLDRHGHFLNGEAVLITPCAFSRWPEEERLARCLPYERQLVPRIFDLSPEAEAELYVESSHTPAMARQKAKDTDGSMVIQRERVERHVLRLAVNRVQRTGEANEFMVPYVLPDESYLYEPGVHTRSRILVAASKMRTKAELLVIRGQGATARATVEDEVTINVSQWRDYVPGAGAPPERYSFLNLPIRGVTLLNACGIPFVPLLVEVLRGPMGNVPYDLVVSPSIIASRNLPVNQDTSPDAQRPHAYPDGAVAAHVRFVKLRMAEFLFRKGLRCSRALVERRFTGYGPGKPDGKGLVEKQFEACLLAGFGWSKTQGGVDYEMPKEYQPHQFTWAENPGWFCLDVQTTFEFEDYATKYDYYALPLVRVEGEAGFEMEPLAPQIGALSPTQLRRYSPEEADALALKLVARHTTNAQEAALIAAGTQPPRLQQWMQQPVPTQYFPSMYRLPIMVFFAVARDYHPYDRLAVLQPSRALDAARASEPGKSKRTFDQMDEREAKSGAEGEGEA